MYMQIVLGVLILRFFFGQVYSYGDGGGYGFGMFEDNLYGIVYLWVGDLDVFNKFDDMGNFGRVVRDLIFYLYYVNIDRIWIIWKMMLGKQRMELNYIDFFDVSFMYYDENVDWVIVKVLQIINIIFFR